MPIKTFLGGRKPIRAKLEIGRKLGEGQEGIVREANLTLTKNGRTRTKQFVIKTFQSILPRKYSFRNPRKQFEVMQGLVELNKKKKLGIRIVPTIRLIKRRIVKDQLLVTRLNILENLSQSQRKEYEDDLYRQRNIGLENGYKISIDSFKPVLGKDGKVNAILTDFGLVVKQSTPFQN